MASNIAEINIKSRYYDVRCSVWDSLIPNFARFHPRTSLVKALVVNQLLRQTEKPGCSAWLNSTELVQ
ncbi:hypothetical protein ACVWZ6_002719 [Bradyrhizobium sp. GM6.1]